MALTAAQIEQQKKQAEELLFSGPETLGFAKALFFGHFQAPLVFPYPVLPPDRQTATEQAVAKVRQFAEHHIDPVAIDRNADIPQEVVRGLGDIGVLGMTAAEDVGGMGFSQQQYCKILEVIGAHDASTAVFVNAHHSIGVRALLLFGTAEQKQKWLPGLMRGEKLAAFALTEAQAGSDAGNVQTTATPTPDGSAYVLNGEKRYITNGGIADVLTVMARTPAPGGDTKVTAFLVSPDMPGFEVIEARAPKCGIRGTATGRMAFHDMRVPAENVLGKVGKGLRVALTVLDYGRTTFGATCTGVAKRCMKAAARYAKNRVQFQQPIAEFELIKKKLAFMAAHAFAMEAMTQTCAAYIDRGFDDYMLETAMLKVFATEHLWTVINETIQIHGGKAYFTDEPYERMMRDARINTIGEGANEVLKSFIAVVGSRGPGMELLGVWNAIFRPLRDGGKILKFGRDQIVARVSTPSVPVNSPDLRREAKRLGKRVREFGLAAGWLLRTSGSEKKFLEGQYQQERIADSAIDLYASACAISRLDHLLTHTNGHPDGHKADVAAGRYFLQLADRRIRGNLAALTANDDAATTDAANALLDSV